MSEDNFLELIASNAIYNGYMNESFQFEMQGWNVTTLLKENNFMELKITKKKQVTYLLVLFQEEIDEDILSYNTTNVKSFNNMKGSINLDMFKEYGKNNQIFYNFIEKYKMSGQILFTGHGLGGSISLIASAIYNIKSIVFAPLPFIISDLWMKNYTFKPKIYLDINDPFSGNNFKLGQINWEISKLYNVTYLNFKTNNFHDIINFVDYFKNNLYKLC